MKTQVTETQSIDVSIPLQDVTLDGNLVIPPEAVGLVIFSHGSGSSRFSPRNNMVAGVLHENSIATLLFDLLSEEEDKEYETRFNIELLTERLVETTKWTETREECKNMNVGYFGASTGAASALNAAAVLSDSIKAVVSRGGRPDLAMQLLPKVKAPVLLIVGGEDREVIALNKKAFRELDCKKELATIPGATHLFEESGALESVADLSAKWFREYLS